MAKEVKDDSSRRSLPGQDVVPLPPCSVGALLRRCGVAADSMAAYLIISGLDDEEFALGGKARGEFYRELGLGPPELRQVLAMDSAMVNLEIDDWEAVSLGLAAMLRNVGVPLDECVRALADANVQFLLRWDVTSELEAWARSRFETEERQTKAVDCLLSVIRDAMKIRRASDLGAASLASDVFGSFDIVLVARALAQSPLTWEARGLIFRDNINVQGPAPITIGEALRLLFGNGWRDPSLRQDDCAGFFNMDITSSGVFPLSALLSEAVWPLHEDFQLAQMVIGNLDTKSKSKIMQLVGAVLNPAPDADLSRFPALIRNVLERTGPAGVELWSESCVTQSENHLFANCPPLRLAFILSASRLSARQLARVLVSRYRHAQATGKSRSHYTLALKWFLSGSEGPENMGKLLGACFSLAVAEAEDNSMQQSSKGLPLIRTI
ncbi:hypothetical protein DFJ74DRAFT_700971 [Hyaloraphidium curvatum]|nr:hypothetical protein DFJ74DRAFT_700971 [Hyaloraphidium curvatum]